MLPEVRQHPRVRGTQPAGKTGQMGVTLHDRAFRRACRACAFMLPFLIFPGCAYVTAVPAKPGSNVQGIRIYDVKPILIVSSGAPKVEIVPNYNRAYARCSSAFSWQRTILRPS